MGDYAKKRFVCLFVYFCLKNEGTQVKVKYASKFNICIYLQTMVPKLSLNVNTSTYIDLMLPALYHLH
jgi:hypothetical protein